MEITSYLLGKKAGGGGGSARLQSKSVTVLENGTTNVVPSTGYDGLSSVAVTTNVSTPILKPSSISFENTYEETEIDLSALDTEYIVQMGNMFTSTNFTSIDISNFNTNNLLIMTNMFADCQYLEEVNFGEIELYNVQEINNLFYYCTALTSVDLSNQDFASLTSADNAFAGMTSLEFLDIRGIDFTNLTSYTDMFTDTNTDCEIIVADDTQKTWLETEFPDFWNVKTVAEYESE